MTALFRHPTTTEKVTVVGRTGSGKSQFGAWLLSEAPFHKQPYVVMDYKRDDLFNLDRIRELALNEVPKHPGLYALRPRGPIDADAVESWFWKVWEKTHVGLFFDEGYAVPTKGGALDALYTQGRSLHIPIITLSQRPVWLPRFAFSEANFYALFHLNDDRDKKTLGQFTPVRVTDDILPEFHSRWFDVAKYQSMIVKPVPKAEDIQQKIFDRLGPRMRKI